MNKRVVFCLALVMTASGFLSVNSYAAGGGAAKGSTLEKRHSALAGDASAGSKKVAVCGACHGNDGNSQLEANPKLAGQGEKYLLKQLKDIKSGKREIAMMQGLLNNMSEQDLADIAAFYGSKTQTQGAAKAEFIELGKEMYRNGNHERGIPACAGCHGPSGNGNAPAGYPKVSGQHAAYIATQLRYFAEGKRENDAERVMRAIAERMNENEIKAVSSYIQGLR